MGASLVNDPRRGRDVTFDGCTLETTWFTRDKLSESTHHVGFLRMANMILVQSVQQRTPHADIFPILLHVTIPFYS
jgi:hypothetical protein